MANFPGSGNAIPGVYNEVITQTNAVSVPGGTRLAVLMGEGSRQERIVARARGNGNDGLNPSYSGTNGSDGRHFILSKAPVIENRTVLFKNGTPLKLLESEIDENSFDSYYDARLDPVTGRIELQKASLVDQGGSYYSALDNTGNGTIENLELIDSNAPTETWTIRCVSVIRDSFGNPIPNTARFIIHGSVSGSPLDQFGNQIVWKSDEVINDNGILKFSIKEGSTIFKEGDRFVIKVKSGALIAGDSLTARYIAVTDLNDPEFFTSLSDLTLKHGSPSIDNRLSLGAQLAFANNPPGIYAVGCAPSIPRRISYTLVSSATGNSTNADLTFVLPVGVIPDPDSNINFFVKDPVTKVETQRMINKVDFYDSDYTANPSDFIESATLEYSYTVVLGQRVVKSASDGVVTKTSGKEATISSSSVTFGLDDLGATRRIRIFNATNAKNNGTFVIKSISNGVLTIENTDSDGFTNESSINFEILDSSGQSAKILFTKDLALSLGESLRCTVVDVKDASFYDVNWEAAYDAISKIDVDIVVPLPSQTISNIFTAGKLHVEEQSNIKNKHERMLFIGAIAGLEPENVLGVEPAAVEDIGILEGIQGDSIDEILSGNIEDLTDYGVQNAYGNSFRVVYFYPDQIAVQAGADRLLVDGFFIAAAAAGYLSGIPDISIPLTNKTLAGFSILRNKLLSPLTIENLCSKGITVLQPVVGGGNVIWGKTTTASGVPEEEEISIIFIRDRIAKTLREAFKGFIGGPETDTLQSTLFARADLLAKSFMSQRLITEYKDLVVQRDPVDPRQWNIYMAVKPVYPVNWIYLRVGIGST